VVINVDDPWGQKFVKKTTAKRVIGYTCRGTDSVVDQMLQAHSIESTLRGVRFQVNSLWGHAEIQTRLLGSFQVYNVLAVLGALLALGVSWQKAVQSLHDMGDVPGRMNIFGGGNRPYIIVDYAHTEEALALALQSMRPWVKGKLWCVMGCGGNRDQSKRRLMGQVAEQYSDQLVLTDDNPRDENPAAIIDDIKSGLLCPWAAIVEHDRASAIQIAISQADPSDMILIAGKGHETTAIFGDKEIPYSDLKQVRRSLEVGYAT
jgi:UDP-N-acetylmuramoyl-L-alanyl-D-glutamate--2,6-diaminopimelate ligase